MSSTMGNCSECDLNALVKEIRDKVYIEGYNKGVMTLASKLEDRLKYKESESLKSQDISEMAIELKRSEF